MKKSSFYTILFSALCTIVNAQSRHDYIWPIGYGATKLLSSGYMRSGILMDFNQDTEPVFSLDSFVTSGPQAAICDTSGLLVAYTDGCHVYNRDHQIMLGGDSLNPGDVFREFCTIRLSYAVWQGNLFLPSPCSPMIRQAFACGCNPKSSLVRCVRLGSVAIQHCGSIVDARAG